MTTLPEITIYSTKDIPSLNTKEGLDLFHKKYKEWKDNNYDYTRIPEAYHQAAYNYALGEKAGLKVIKNTNKRAKQILPIVLSPLALPAASAAGTAYAALPTSVLTGLNLAGNIGAGIELVSDNGVKKTINKAKQGDYQGAVVSGLGDLAATTGVIGTTAKLANSIKNSYLLLRKGTTLPKLWVATSKNKYFSNGLDEFNNILDRAKAPLSTKTYLIYTGNWDELAKQRLLNGGFDKINITPEAKYSQNESMRDFILNTKPIIGKSVSPLYSFKKEAIYLPKIDNVNYNNLEDISKGTAGILAHERSHLVDHMINKSLRLYTLKDIPESAFNFVKPVPGLSYHQVPSRVKKYFNLSGLTELKARFGQVKNYLGKTDPYDPVTLDEWNFARRHYVPDIGFDNNMQLFFRVVKDPEVFLKHMNKIVPVATGTVVMPKILNINNLKFKKYE